MPLNGRVFRDRLRRVLYRTRAWRRVFFDGERISGDGQIIVAQLKRFARYGKPPAVQDRTGRTDLFETGRMVGRQEVVQLMIEALNLDERLLVNLQEEIPDE